MYVCVLSMCICVKHVYMYMCMCVKRTYFMRAFLFDDGPVIARGGSSSEVGRAGVRGGGRVCKLILAGTPLLIGNCFTYL